MKLERPILVGGLGLSFGLLALNGLQHSLGEIDGSLVLGAIAVGSGVWWLRKLRSQSSVELKIPTRPVTPEELQQAFQQTESRIAALQAELAGTVKLAEDTAESHTESEPSPQPDFPQVQALRQQLEALKESCDRTSLQITVAGNTLTGKTSLIQHCTDLVNSSDSAASGTWLELDSGVYTNLADLQQLATEPLVQSSDLMVVVVDSDLTDSDFQRIRQLLSLRHRVVLAFNKQDQYTPSDRTRVLQQIQARLQDLVAHSDIMGIAADPRPIKVKRHQEDGQIEESLEQPEPVMQSLVEQLQQIVQQDQQSLVYGTVWRQAQALQRVAQQQINALRRDRAMPILEQYQWVSAGAAFANPLPSLDLLATAAVSTQMIVEVGQIYGQRFSLAQAKAIATTLATQTVKLGLVELSTNMLMGLVLKGHTLTYVAGGMIQGLSAAYLTRLAGLSLIEFFEEQSLNAAAQSEASIPSVEQITQKLQATFQQMQQGAWVQALVQKGIQRLTTADAASEDPSNLSTANLAS
ncbi:MAG: slr1306 family protein [Thainema sp.]